MHPCLVSLKLGMASPYLLWYSPWGNYFRELRHFLGNLTSRPIESGLQKRHHLPEQRRWAVKAVELLLSTRHWSPTHPPDTSVWGIPGLIWIKEKMETSEDFSLSPKPGTSGCARVPTKVCLMAKPWAFPQCHPLNPSDSESKQIRTTLIRYSLWPKA